LRFVTHHLYHPVSGDNDIRRGIYESLELGCVPVLLPRQRPAVNYIAGGALRRAGLHLDEVFYFLPKNQIRDGVSVLAKLQELAADAAYMAQRRQALFRAARFLYLSSEETDDSITLSLGLLMAGEHH
jgi:hypothetical protein